MRKNSLGSKAPIFLWVLVTTFFAFQFVLRQSAGIMREDIMLRFGANIVEFGSLAGCYYLGYAGMQIPVGIMLDKFSLRLVVFCSILTASLGTLTFVFAHSWPELLIGRFMIGAGSAVGFLGVAKVTKTFFAPKYHSFMIGFSFTFGLLGAVFGSAPMKFVFNHYGYEATFMLIGLCGIALAFFILAITSRRIVNIEYQAEENVSLANILDVILNPIILFIGVCGGLMVGSLEGFADVWAIPFFKDVYGYPAEQSVFAPSIIFFGMCVGGPILVYIAETLKSHITVIFFTGVLTCLIFAVLLFTQTNFFVVAALMFVLGILCCYQVLVFSITTRIVAVAHAGIGIAIVNCINMSFGHFFHKAISWVLHTNYDGAINQSGQIAYSQNAYFMALLIIPICCAIGMIGFVYIGQKLKKINNV